MLGHEAKLQRHKRGIWSQDSIGCSLVDEMVDCWYGRSAWGSLQQGNNMGKSWLHLSRNVVLRQTPGCGGRVTCLITSHATPLQGFWRCFCLSTRHDPSGVRLQTEPELATGQLRCTLLSPSS
jgi:hypothetical protein